MHTSKVTLAMFAAMASTVIAAPHRIISGDVKSRGEYDRTREADSYKPDADDDHRRRPSQDEYEKQIKGKDEYKGRYNKDQRVVKDGSHRPQRTKPEGKDYEGTRADDYADDKTNYDRKQDPKNKDEYYD